VHACPHRPDQIQGAIQVARVVNCSNALVDNLFEARDRPLLQDVKSEASAQEKSQTFEYPGGISLRVISYQSGRDCRSCSISPIFYPVHICARLQQKCD